MIGGGGGGDALWITSVEATGELDACSGVDCSEATPLHVFSCSQFNTVALVG